MTEREEALLKELQEKKKRNRKPEEYMAEIEDLKKKLAEKQEKKVTIKEPEPEPEPDPEPPKAKPSPPKPPSAPKPRPPTPTPEPVSIKPAPPPQLPKIYESFARSGNMSGSQISNLMKHMGL